MTQRITHVGAISRISLVCGLLFFSGVFLTGCASEPTPTPTLQPSHTATTTSAAKTTPTATAVPSALAGEDTGFTCETLLSLQEVFDFNPNYYLSSSSPTSLDDELGKSTASLNGITCEYVSQSDGPPIQLSLVKIQGDGISQVKSQLTSAGKTTSVYGNEPAINAYFTKTGEVGTINILVGNFWFSGSSQSFTAPEDGAKILTPVVTKLG